MTMAGPAIAKEMVNDYLKEDFPERLIAYRNVWNLDDYLLPDPVDYFTYEPLAMDHWPTIITVVISTQSMTRQDYDFGMNPEYRVRYNMRTYLWVRGDSNQIATEMRDRLSTVMRSAFLDYPCLRAATNGHLFVEEGSLREEFSDVTLLKGDRALAGSYVAYDMFMDEVIVRKSTGDVSGFSTEVKNVSIDNGAFDPW